jgi:uncharacterized protein YjbJ (UPF0337 family)
MGITEELTKRVRQVAEDERVRRATGAGVGFVDKATGRVKQTAGDFLNNERLRRQGRQEEVKGDLRDDLAVQRVREEKERVEAETRARQARDEAADQAQRAFQRAERKVEAEETRVESEMRRTDAKASAVEAMEKITDPDELEKSSTKPELQKRASGLGIAGYSRMSKRELAEEIVKAQ